MTTLMSLDSFFHEPPYGLCRPQREPLLLKRLSQLTLFHTHHCPSYRNMMAFFPDTSSCAYALEDIPFLPVRLFKEMDLKSIPSHAVQKTLVSSGTTGNARSRITLNRQSVTQQAKVLAHIASHFAGLERVPMLVIDSQATLTRSDTASARAAAISGFSLFGRPMIYALNDQNRLDLNVVKDFAERYGDQPVLVFGFTFLVFSKLLKSLEEQNIRLNLNKGILVHGGGWKKMTDQSISAVAFRHLAHARTGVRAVHNYYGLVEQTGSIFFECEQNHLHCSIFSDVLVRDARLQPSAMGERGLLHVLSVLPESYPGHSLLTEDEATLLGEDDCTCGRKGKYFVVHGRIRNAEVRGCSDTHS